MDDDKAQPALVQEFGLTWERFNALEVEITTLQAEWQSALKEIYRLKAAQPAQEPVAWLEPEWGEKICPEVGYEVTMTDDHPRDLCWIPLYAQRPWVDLTEEEIEDLFQSAADADEETHIRFALAIQAKFKMKNI